MKILNNQNLIDFFHSAISKEYDLWLPIKLHDGTRSLGKIKDGELCQRKTGFPGLAPIDPSSVEFTKDYPCPSPFGLAAPFNSAPGGISQLGGKEQATGVYFPYMTVARDEANNAGNHNAKGIALAGGALPMKPTSLFMPYLDLMMSFQENGKTITPTKPKKPKFIVGFTAEDLDCLAFVDKFFSTDYSDQLYFNKRDEAIIVGISGWCGEDNSFLKIAGGKCDLELICVQNDQFILQAYTGRGKNIAKYFAGQPNTDAKVFAELNKISKNLPNDDAELLQKASQLLLENKVPDEFWQSIADRCIACTACTLLCPTCTCFDVFDQKRSTANKTIDRWRMCDSCQLEGFMREASGHNPMGTECLRTRRRIQHKLAADMTRWGHITCFLCGRCDQACPSDIGIKSVCREMVERYG